MKCLIIAFHPRSMSHYVNAYEASMKAAGIPYDVVFWDRFSNGDLDKIDNEFTLHRICTLGGNKVKKIPAFIYFRNKLKYIIENDSYDKIVVLNTMPGILLSDILLKKYRNKYILDIRDYTYEKFRFYKYRVERLIDNSFFTAISSEGFKEFLGNSSKLVTNHNISNIEHLQNNKDAKGYESLKRKVYNIGFLGVVRYERENLKLITAFKNSDVLKFYYIGRMYPECKLREFCENNSVTNVAFKPEFSNEEKPELYKNIDMINAVYGSNSIEVTTALPNKLYDALIFKKPMLVSKNTYLSSIVDAYNLGVSIDIDNDNIKDVILNYINSDYSQEFFSGTEKFLKKVLLDQEIYKKRIDEFIRL